MASNGEFIGILEKGAITELNKGIKGVKEITDNIKSAVGHANELNNAFKNIKIPSQARGLITQLNTVLATNNQLIEQQIVAQRRLREGIAATNNIIAENGRARASNNQRTQEEITNTRLLTQNANLAATANSTFANSYQRLSAQQAIAARRVQDLIARGRTAEQTQRQYNRELKNAQREFNALNTRVLAADRAVGRFNRNVGNYPGQAIKGLKDLVLAFGLVGGVQAFAAITKDIFNTTRELQSLDLALKQVGSTTDNFARSQEFLARISDAYGIEIKGLTRSYTGFLAASKNAIESGAITAGQINDIFESVSKASGAMGLSVEQQQGAFLALQQMISKGNVQAEEIRGQLAERLPGAFGILAKSMKVTEQQLNKMLKDGTVLATEVLPAFAKELEKAYGVENLNRVESLTAETVRLSNAWTELIRTISEGDGAVSKFFSGTVSFASKALQGIDEFFKSADQKQNDIEVDAETKSYEELTAALKESSKASDDNNKTKLENARLSKENIKTAVEEAKAIKNRSVEALSELRSQRATIVNSIKANENAIKNLKDPLGNPTNIGNGKYLKNITDLNSQYDALMVTSRKYQGELSASIDFINDNTEATVENGRRTVAVIEAEITAQEKLLKLTTKRGEAIPIQDTIKALEAEKIAILGEEKRRKAAREKAHKQDMDYLKEVYELQKQNIENHAADEETIMNYETKNYDTRLAAANNFYFQKEALLKLEHDEEIRLNKLEYDNQTENYKLAIRNGTATKQQLDALDYQYIVKRKRIDEKYEYDKTKLTIESARKLQGVLLDIQAQNARNTQGRLALGDTSERNSLLAGVSGSTTEKQYTDLANKMRDLDNSALDRADKLTQIDLDRVKAKIEEIKLQEPNIENNQAINELLKEQIGYEQALKDIETERLQKVADLRHEMKTATDELFNSIKSGFLSDMGLSSLAKFTDQVTYQFVNAAGEIETKTGSTFDKMIDQAQTAGEKLKVIGTTALSTFQEVFNFMQQNNQARFDAELTNIEREYEIRKKFAGGNADAEEELEKQLADKKRDIRTREAKAAKETALFNAIINTASAVVAALPNIAASILVGTLGAIQIGLIASKPVPAYAEGIFGNESHPGGKALVGDGGKHEVIRYPDGKMALTPNKNTLIDLPKGSQVYPDIASSGILNSGLPAVAMNRVEGVSASDMERIMDKTLAKMPVNGITFDAKGYSAYSERQGQRTEYKNRIASFQGRKIK